MSPRQRVADLLYLKIRQAGYSMGDLSREMGLAPDQVSRLLKGQLLLRLEHVSQMLEILGVPPAGFWAEVDGMARAAPPFRPLGYSRDPDEVLLAGMTRGELMEEVRRVVREELERRAGETQHAATRPAPRRRRAPDRRSQRAKRSKTRA
jgi:transcriptional regulator with XRE-family HTH domain